MRTGVKVLVLVSGAMLAGLSFPAMPFREDEKVLFWRALDLNRKWDSAIEWSDSLEEGWLKLATPGKFFHDWKGIARRWWLENDKVAFKGSMFIIDMLLLSYLF